MAEVVKDPKKRTNGLTMADLDDQENPSKFIAAISDSGKNAILHLVQEFSEVIENEIFIYDLN